MGALTLISLTGNRPAAWSLCEQWMLAQDFDGPVRWLIVDDCEPATAITFERENWTLEVLRPTPAWAPGQNTQTRNIRAALEVVTNDERVAVIEDDDVYLPGWLSAVDYRLQRADLVGEVRARYYNAARRVGRELKNCGHSSLCSTAFKGAATDTLRRIVQVDRSFIDLTLWRTFRGRRELFQGHAVVGIKGLPGRAGLGMGHRPGFAGANDPDGALLARWIGNDRAAAVLRAAKG
jgi:hypothetical protein